MSAEEKKVDRVLVAVRAEGLSLSELAALVSYLLNGATRGLDPITPAGAYLEMATAAADRARRAFAQGRG